MENTTVRALKFWTLFSFSSQINCCFSGLEFTKCLSERQTGKSLIRLLLQKPTDLGLHCLSMPHDQNFITLTIHFTESRGSVVRGLDLDLKGCSFEAHRRWSHCVVSMSKTLYLLLTYNWFNPGWQEIILTWLKNCWLAIKHQNKQKSLTLAASRCTGWAYCFPCPFSVTWFTNLENIQTFITSCHAAHCNCLRSSQILN